MGLNTIYLVSVNLYHSSHCNFPMVSSRPKIHVLDMVPVYTFLSLVNDPHIHDLHQKVMALNSSLRVIAFLFHTSHDNSTMKTNLTTVHSHNYINRKICDITCLPYLYLSTYLLSLQQLHNVFLYYLHNFSLEMCVDKDFCYNVVPCNIQNRIRQQQIYQ